MTFPHLRFIDKNKDKALFFSTLRQRVDAHFKKNNLSKHYDSKMVVKTIVLLSTYIVPFVLLLVFQPPMGLSTLLWLVMAFGLAGIGMSVMHDANHGAYSRSATTNHWLGHSLNLLGGSVVNWKVQHNLLHHTYTNIATHDNDIEDKAILRFSPHTRVKWFHKLQVVSAFFFYGLTTIYWATFKDFMQYFRYKREGHTKNNGHPALLLGRIILDKLLYFFVFLFVPISLVGLPAGQVVYGFLIMHFVAGIILTVIFQLAHTVEGTSHPLPDESGTVANTWAIHQMNTTVNFSRQHKFITWYVGGLNYQVEHHLFPNICHVHYPEISEIVKTTAEEFGVPYLENKTFREALVSHFETLRRFGKLPSLDEVLA